MKGILISDDRKSLTCCSSANENSHCEMTITDSCEEKSDSSFLSAGDLLDTENVSDPKTMLIAYLKDLIKHKNIIIEQLQENISLLKSLTAIALEPSTNRMVKSPYTEECQIQSENKSKTDRFKPSTINELKEDSFTRQTKPVNHTLHVASNPQKSWQNSINKSVNQQRLVTVPAKHDKQNQQKQKIIGTRSTEESVSIKTHIGYLSASIQKHTLEINLKTTWIIFFQITHLL